MFQRGAQRASILSSPSTTNDALFFCKSRKSNADCELRVKMILSVNSPTKCSKTTPLLNTARRESAHAESWSYGRAAGTFLNKPRRSRRSRPGASQSLAGTPRYRASVQSGGRPRSPAADRRALLWPWRSSCHRADDVEHEPAARRVLRSRNHFRIRRNRWALTIIDWLDWHVG
jgi:hypothetical protein